MSALTRHWELKLLALVVSMVLWVFVMTSEKADVVVAAPIELDGIPAGLEVKGERPDSVDVQLHGLRVALDARNRSCEGPREPGRLEAPAR